VRLILREHADDSSVNGLDEWLENILAGVPELAICYHREGVVEGYSIISTAEIPTVLGGFEGFEPKHVTEKAHSVLSFLHTNCSSDAGSYWLHKEAGSSTLRLYEIADDVLASQSLSLADHSGLLCYRIGLKLSSSATTSVEAKNTLQCKLFTRALELLDDQLHPIVCLDLHERLSSLLFQFVPPFPAEHSRSPAEGKKKGKRTDDGQALVLRETCHLSSVRARWSLDKQPRVNCEASLNHLEHW